MQDKALTCRDCNREFAFLMGSNWPPSAGFLMPENELDAGEIPRRWRLHPTTVRASIGCQDGRGLDPAKRYDLRRIEIEGRSTLAGATQEETRHGR